MPATRRVLSTDLACTDYESLGAHLLTRSQQPSPYAVDFSNTHIVTMRRHDPAFAATTASIDLFVPDGMPLIWCLNSQGAALQDRVYGPTFLRKFLATCPSEFSHYFLGGSPECGKKLRERLLDTNPQLNIVGFQQGYFSHNEERSIFNHIVASRPDFLWIGLGTPKQQELLQRLKPLLPSGILLAVGFAFDVNAGTKPDAPAWMQRAGLTWIYRLATEPRRLATRYLKWNSLFLYYLLIKFYHNRKGGPFEIEQQKVGPKGESSGSERVKGQRG
jgi:N-acetylglucosaminyldiphosphoundecaprenol N-acetyl-beta-D-mannosaminyltransferase